MLSVTLESNGSPKKRTFSRGISEDESLRSIIKETESSSRRHQAGTLKRRSDSQVGGREESKHRYTQLIRLVCGCWILLLTELISDGDFTKSKKRHLKENTQLNIKRSEQDLFMGLPEMLELQASYDEVVQELRGLEVEREALLFQVDVLQDTLEGVEELLAEAQREAGQASLELERERQAKRKLESMVYSLMQEVERLKEESNNKPSAPANTHEGTEEITKQGRQQQESVAGSEEKESSLCKNGPGQGEGTEEEGGVLMKLKKMVNKPLSHVPSLALDNPLCVDGVLQRPYENRMEEERDPSPDQNDTDSLSAYEDASAETPEQDRPFLGESDTLELPHDSDDHSHVRDGETGQPKTPENCVVS